jgi:hypothetical protein
MLGRYGFYDCPSELHANTSDAGSSSSSSKATWAWRAVKTGDGIEVISFCAR